MSSLFLNSFLLFVNAVIIKRFHVNNFVLENSIDILSTSKIWFRDNDSGLLLLWSKKSAF